MRKSTKTMVTLGMAAALVLTGFANVSAAKKEGKDTAKEQPAAAQEQTALKAKATCTAAGKINVSFSGAVEWSEDAAAALIDEEQKEITVSIAKKANRSVVVKGSGMVKGKPYTLSISGVKAKGAAEFGTVTAAFKAKKLKSSCKAKKISKKVAVKSKNTIIVKCKGQVQTKDVTVEVLDEADNRYDAAVTGKSKGNIKVKVSGLKKGKTYTITINGVKTKKETNYASIRTTFATKK